MSAQDDRKASGTIFNIQKYSVHDGPGIRTIVFLKGCPLSCRWCSNPESQAFQPELAFNEGRCLGFAQCTRCLAACPRQAISEKDGKPAFNRGLCAGCDRPCVAACPSQGVIAYGRQQTVDEILKVVEQDGQFYSRSGGGLTLSGGEPLAQPAFALALLREAKRRHMATAIETSGYVPWEVLAEACANLDFLLYDIKNLDEARHEQGTGVNPGRIVDNLRRVGREFPDLPVHVRTPLIPGFNDDEGSIRAICALVRELPKATYEVLPYHRLGTQKYRFLDRVPPMGEAVLDPHKAARLEEIARECMAAPAAG